MSTTARPYGTINSAQVHYSHRVGTLAIPRMLPKWPHEVHLAAQQRTPRECSRVPGQGPTHRQPQRHRKERCLQRPSPAPKPQPYTGGHRPPATQHQPLRAPLSQLNAAHMHLVAKRTSGTGVSRPGAARAYKAAERYTVLPAGGASVPTLSHKQTRDATLILPTVGPLPDLWHAMRACQPVLVGVPGPQVSRQT